MAIRKSSTSGVPFGNTANRPANPQVGQTYYNGELGYQEIYTNAGWIPAAGGNDFNLNITGTYTTVTFSQSFAGGSYSIVSSGNDATIDIYAYASDGSLAGYTATKAFTATQRFNKMVVIGGTTGDVLSFSYKTTFATSATTTETTAGPFITSISPSAMPNVNDTVTITGGNFANDVQVAFTAAGYSSTAAKNIVRSSASSLIVTRPDNFPTSSSPYTVTVTNPGISSPVGSSANISLNSITAGNAPVWNTSSTLPAFTKNIAYSTIVSASDPDAGGSITYSVVSNSLPTGLSFNTLTGSISGTPTVVTNGSITIRATDIGGNFVDRAFTVPNIGSNAPVWVTASGNLTVYASSSYSVQLSATDDSGSAPIYSLVSGSLPTGLSLSSAGLISGSAYTGTTAGSSTFTVRATDANGSFTDRSFTIPFTYFNVGASFTFTAAGGSGRTAVSDATFYSTYSGTPWTQSTANFTVSSGVQSWVVPATGSYTFDVVGGAGGSGTTGGFAGRAVGTHSLTQGTVVKIVCGHKGGNGSTGRAETPPGGGGGMSAVWINTPNTIGNILCVAGGGGGSTTSQGGSGSSTTSISSANAGDGGNRAGVAGGGINNSNNFLGGAGGTDGNGSGGSGGFGAGGGAGGSGCYNDGGGGGGGGITPGSGGGAGPCQQNAAPAGGGGNGYAGGTSASYTGAFQSSTNGYVTVTRVS